MVKLTVADSAGHTDSATHPVSVRDDPPTASYTSSCEGLVCILDGSASTDDGGIVDYTWYVQGDSVAGGPEQSSFTLTFSREGALFVSLRVRDGADPPQEAWKRGFVAAGDVVADFDLSGRCGTDHSCEFDASGSSAPVGIGRYVWHVDGNSVGSLRGSRYRHEFPGLGEYRVRLTVSGRISGRTADTTRVLHITSDSSWLADEEETDGVPVAAFTDSCAGRACTFDGSGSTDGVRIETYAWTVEGNSVGTADTLFHRFASDGTYAVRLIVTDSASQADTLSRDVVVEDLPPAAGLTVSCDSLACVFDGSSSTDDDGIATYAWTVDGDSVGTVTADTLAYTFASAGTYNVGLRVSDTAVPSQTSDSTLSVTVPADPPPPPATRPDLEVGAPTVSDRTPETGATFTLSATVTNAGAGASGATTLRYYRSADATISRSDEEEAETGAVGGLAAGATSAESISVTAPSTSGTYYYGACVDAVANESDTTDNCSAAVRVDVEDPPPPQARPDLEVGVPTVSDRTPETGASFTLSTTVTNAGDGPSAATTLRYYRSADATIGSSDTAVGTDQVGGLAAGGTSAESISLTAPSTSGTYYYGACVDAVAGESDTTDNCSAAVRVDVEDPPPPPQARPDLEVGAPTVSDRTPETGASFTLSTTVTNAGDGPSAATTLRYYRSADATIGSSDTAVGTDQVGGLAAGGTSAESISLTAPSTSGTYYYGACVDAVAGESDTTDNCSAAVRVDVEDPPPPPQARPDLEVGAPTVSDRTPETGASFTLSATVTNAGDGPSAATTLRYYLSADATIGSSDTAVGTDQVGALAAGGTSAESISLRAPATSGTYYYGACVDAVARESDTTDNCSAAVRVDVEDPPPDLEVGTPT
ncbi:CARDB domain-containing protein [Candidatus Palauibacter sp.]|uniref:CARDB domain-containing protein n=1 Tax=Candidatus Palauibacter sp. TaxID=3101350 RepID=UPI003C6F547C